MGTLTYRIEDCIDGGHCNHWTCFLYVRITFKVSRQQNVGHHGACEVLVRYHN